MYRTAIRVVPRLTPRTLPRHSVRFASSAPAAKKSTWRGAALRWGVALGALYIYNTNPLFQDDPNPTKTVLPPPQFSDDDAPTVEAVISQKRKQSESKALARQKATEQEANPDSVDVSKPTGGSTAAPGDEGGMGGLEDEAGQQGAFNPETGEINWDCPCLGGMADGPCGEDFKAAFSCFVYSKEEPKGIDCIDKFQGMQECFRKYPEIYGDELADDEEGGDPSSPPVPPTSEEEGQQDGQPAKGNENALKEKAFKREQEDVLSEAEAAILEAPPVEKGGEAPNNNKVLVKEKKPIKKAAEVAIKTEKKATPKSEGPKDPSRDAS